LTVYDYWFFLRRSVQRIKKSHQRGESCLKQEKLKGVKDEQVVGVGIRYPRLYAEEEVTEEEMEEQQQVILECRLFEKLVRYHCTVYSSVTF